MPITPLHFGVLAPINHLAHKKVSNTAFVLTTLWIDWPAIYSVLTDTPFPAHDGYHSLMGMALIVLLLGAPGLRYPSWFWGVVLGCLSHLLLDGLVHSDMQPFEPFIEGNPIYMNWMEPVSIALLPLTVWFIVQCVSNSLVIVRRVSAAFARQKN